MSITEPTSSPQRLAQIRQMLKSGEARAIRERAQVSQTEMASAIGVTPAAVSRWEAGRRRPGTTEAALYGKVLDSLAPSTGVDEMADPRSHPAIGWREAIQRDGREGLPPTTRLAALMLAQFTNGSGQAWPSVGTVAAAANLSERSTREHLALLVDRGWLKVRIRGGVVGGPRCTHYELTTPGTNG